MADSNRIVFPDEKACEEKAAPDVTDAPAEDKTSGGDTNTLDTPPEITMRNFIQAPPNCPPGYKMGADGVCREVFN